MCRKGTFIWHLTTPCTIPIPHHTDGIVTGPPVVGGVGSQACSWYPSVPSAWLFVGNHF